ncbi:hypothetical protein [Jiangella asiatica]|uniref:3-keto-alpha-glucoside-1,2-lyase/3-keto-2-hydroxy-glucal hydratase domain-containing protein n=1 Tax=Jiangella asiatica TaxID=2530372 RepID=A0A4R5DCY5_9ACTN|nr:hypothetical protein [Jiangella asiatica]TDE09691.1 hypothetical protein E1269_13780 [Jiangella asiatica]
MHEQGSPHQQMMPNRRDVLRAMGTGALAAGSLPVFGVATATGASPSAGIRHSTLPAASSHHPQLIAGEEFPIGIWLPPPLWETTVERYQEIKDAGFTYAHSNNYLNAHFTLQQYALNIAHQVGLKLVVDDPTIYWMTHEFSIKTGDGDFTLSPEQARIKTQQVIDHYRPRSFWELQDGHLFINGGSGAGTIGLSNDGTDWSDYTFALDVAPLQTGGGGAYAQGGWAFRAQDPQNAYVWLLANPERADGAPGHLAKVLFVDGSPVWIRTVPLDFAVTHDTWYHVEMVLSGETITTSINGEVIDVTTDNTYLEGRVGFREAGDETAYFDNVEVTTEDESLVLTDDFSGDFGKWKEPSAGGFPSFVGINLYDEPQPDRFETLARQVEIVRALSPESLPYINILPTNDPGYVREFVDVVKPPLISFDRYPLLLDGSDDPNYFLNWKFVRDEGLRAKLHTWIFIQTVAYRGHREPTAAEILWQINVSLAYGCKGIQYFTYWTPHTVVPEDFHSALITLDGERTERYDAAKEINTGWLSPVGRELKPLVSESVTHANDDPLPNGATAFSADDYVRAARGDAVVLGRFRSADASDRTRWLLVANRAHSASASARLTPGAAVGEIELFDPQEGVYGRERGSGQITVDLPPGAAALYRLQPGTG